MLAFTIGLFIGCFVGVLIMCLCAAARFRPRYRSGCRNEGFLPDTWNPDDAA